MERKKIIFFSKKAVIIGVVLVFLCPGVIQGIQISDNTHNPRISQSYPKDFNCKGELSSLHVQLSRSQSASVGENVVISGEGDDRLPAITRDEYGYTVVTWTNEESSENSNLGFVYSSEPLDPSSWSGWIINLSGFNVVMYSDIGLIEGFTDEMPKLLGVYIAPDSDRLGGYEIKDITSDPSEWVFFFYTQEKLDPKYASISDGFVYDYVYDSPVVANMYIYHVMLAGEYDITDCPVCMGYIDGQSRLLTAPAIDPDIVAFEDRFHVTWQYMNASLGYPQIVWKKIVPADEPDIEFTPFQEYLAAGYHPAISGLDENIVIVYMDSEGGIQCAYSFNDGETWENSTVVDGDWYCYPDVYARGDEIVCAYIHSPFDCPMGNLYVKKSFDGGITWSDPYLINDVNWSVFAEENTVDIHRGGIVWCDQRNVDLDIYYEIIPSEAPDKPEITDDPKRFESGKEFEFHVCTTDPQSDDIYYRFDWGDGTESDWIGPFASGEEGNATHAWDTLGDYEIRAKAKDISGHESEWSEVWWYWPIDNNHCSNPMLQRILAHHFPNLYFIINYFFNFYS